MSEAKADEYGQDLWYLSDARSVWESLLHFKRSNGHLISRIITSLLHKKTLCEPPFITHEWTDTCTVWLTPLWQQPTSNQQCNHRSFVLTAVTHNTCYSFMVVEQSVVSHTVSFLRCGSLGNGRLYVRVAVGFDSHIYSARSVTPLYIHRHKHTTGPAPPALPSICSHTAIQPKYIDDTQIQVCTQR